MIFYFTFGQVHTHPITDEPMKDYWVEVHCDEMTTARRKMIEIFGLRWGLMYDEETFTPEYYPKGCYMKLGHPEIYPSIKCPKCKMVSYNINDIKHKFCGNCHEYHDALNNIIELQKKRMKIIQELIPKFYSITKPELKMTKNWKIEYINEPMFTITGEDRVTNYQTGYYKITYEGCMYGTIGKQAFDEMKTGDILHLVEQMLNDAHDLALKQHD